MRSVTLRTYKEEKFLGDCSADISEDDASLLRGYAKNIERLSSAKLIQNGLPVLRKMNFEQGSGFSFEFSPYEMSEIHELLHLCRPLFLKNEPNSFEKSLALVGRRFESPHIRSHLKAIRNLYRDGENRRYFNFSVNGVSLFDNDTFNAWLNGVEYHQDPEKNSIVEMLKGALSEESARGFFVEHLTNRVTALYMLNNNLIKVILEKYES